MASLGSSGHQMVLDEDEKEEEREAVEEADTAAWGLRG